MKTGNTTAGDSIVVVLPGASMEPGHEDREYLAGGGGHDVLREPQWSPVMKTGTTRQAAAGIVDCLEPQWSPVMKTGNTGN